MTTVALGTAPAERSGEFAREDSDALYAARGLGIFLVSLAHIVSGPQNRLIYLFHMPFFFLVSGIALRGFGTIDTTSTARRLRAMIIPTVVAMVLTTGFALLAGGCLPRSASEFVACGRTVFGSPGFSGAFTAYWFIGALCVLQVAILALGSQRQCSWPIAAAAAIGTVLALNIPALSSAPKFVLGAVYGLQFFLLGFLVPWAFYRRDVRFILLVGASAAALVPGIPLTLDLAARDFGVPLVSAVYATLLSLAFVVLFLIPGKGGALLRGAWAPIGKASLLILLYHQAIQLTMNHLVPGVPRAVALITAVALPTVAFYTFRPRRRLAGWIGAR